MFLRTLVACRFVPTLFLAASIPVAAAIEDGNDFSNNLFSDLGPIIALFGEQVAKQFMAGSLGLADNILFAMACCRTRQFATIVTDDLYRLR